MSEFANKLISEGIEDGFWEDILSITKKLAQREWDTIIIVEKTSKGKSLFLARNTDLVRCTAQGDTKKKAVSALAEATHTHLAIMMYYACADALAKDIKHAHEIYTAEDKGEVD